jgi:beta-galactosidase
VKKENKNLSKSWIRKRSAFKMKGLVSLLSLSMVCHAHVTLAEARVVNDLDCGWRFSRGDSPSWFAPGFDDSSWRLLDVPHDWSIEGDYSKTNPTVELCGYLPSGVAWYRREIQVTNNCLGKAFAVEFEGIYMNSEVWANGLRVGSRSYGYMSFTCDLTSCIKTGRNVIAVRVDNSREPSARWYHGCGIYGHVRLIVTDQVHIPPSGVFVQTPTVNERAAVVRADVEVKNRLKVATEVTVQMEVLGPDRQSCAYATTSTNVPPDETITVTQESALKHPRLWSLETRSLYTLRTRVLRAGSVVDEVETPFGIRTLRFDAKTGFYLNDKPVKLKGVCEHLGGSPVGAAMPEALMERRLLQLKAMGCNAIRVAHNPQLPGFYDLCDRLGFLVMDEIFDGWHEKADHDYGGRFFAAEWQRDVTDWVRRDRNHPCVIFWSIGNETGLNDKHKITELIHTLDTTRPTTGGAVIHGVDVAGFNGGIVEKDSVLLNYHRDHPETPIVMTEEPHSFQTRGFYRTVRSVFKDMDNLPNYAEPEVFSGGHTAYRSSYDNCGRRLVARNCWKRTLERPWVMGEFRWTGFDYQGEAGWSGFKTLARAFNFGIIDLAGFPKDHYYFYQSVWTDEPMVHLLPHWTHPGLEGKAIPVVAYANAEEIELFQDGKSLGRKPRSDLFECVWQVTYMPGELKAIAYRGGKAVAVTEQLTAGRPAQLKLTTDNSKLKPSRKDLALVSVAVTDRFGTVVPSADSHIGFALIGPARYLGGENGDPVDSTAQREPWRKTFQGLARAFYAGVDGQEDAIEVVAFGILADTYIKDFSTVTIAFERVALRGPLAKKSFEIHYTLDGSEPSYASPRYTAPFLAERNTTVRAIIICAGKVLTTSVATLSEQTDNLPVVAPVSKTGDQGTAEDPSHEKQGKKNP